MLLDSERDGRTSELGIDPRFIIRRHLTPRDTALREQQLVSLCEYSLKLQLNADVVVLDLHSFVLMGECNSLDIKDAEDLSVMFAYKPPSMSHFAE